jgi:hypothetical protein
MNVSIRALARVLCSRQSINSKIDQKVHTSIGSDMIRVFIMLQVVSVILCKDNYNGVINANSVFNFDENFCIFLPFSHIPR